MRCLLVHGQVKVWWILPSQTCCSLNEDAIDFVLAMSLLSAVQHYKRVFLLFPETWQILRMQISYIDLPKFGADCYILIYTHNPELISQWVVMSVDHCYLWWIWWSDTSWATCIRLWLHSLPCYVQRVVEIYLQLDKPFWLWVANFLGGPETCTGAFGRSARRSITKPLSNCISCALECPASYFFTRSPEPTQV